MQVDPESPSGISWKESFHNVKAGQPVGWLTNKGYWRASWTFNGKHKSRGCHALVLELSGQPSPGKGYEPDHIDRNRANNKIENLRWATRSKQTTNKQYPNAHGYRYVRKHYNKYGFQVFVKGKWIAGSGFTTAAEAHAAAVRMREQLGLDGQEV